VRGVNGTAIRLGSSAAVEILNDGTIRQDGAVVGQLELADFTSKAGLVKQGSNYLRVADPKLLPSAPAAGTTVEQGKLEVSNTGSAEAAVRLVSVMRQFEMLQKAASLGAEMNRRAIEEVAKVGS